MNGKNNEWCQQVNQQLHSVHINRNFCSSNKSKILSDTHYILKIRELQLECCESAAIHLYLTVFLYHRTTPTQSIRLETNIFSVKLFDHILTQTLQEVSAHRVLGLSAHQCPSDHEPYCCCNSCRTNCDSTQQMHLNTLNLLLKAIQSVTQ